MRCSPAEHFRPRSRKIAKKLRAKIALLVVNHPSYALPVTASFGVANLKADDAGMRDVLKRADTPLYCAKKRIRSINLVSVQGSILCTTALPKSGGIILHRHMRERALGRECHRLRSATIKFSCAPYH